MIIGIIGPLFSSTKIKDCLKEIDPHMEIKIYIREKDLYARSFDINFHIKSN